jgi:hypothetical protein
VFRWIDGGRRSIAAQYTDSTRPTHVVLAGDFFPSFFVGNRQFLAIRGIGGIVAVTKENGKATVQPLI